MSPADFERARFAPGRVWNLWEIMQFSDSKSLIGSVAWLSSLRTTFQIENAAKQIFSKDTFDLRLAEICALESAARGSGLVLTANYASELAKAWRAAEIMPEGRVMDGVTLEKIGFYADRVCATVADESRTKLFLVLAPEDAKKIEPTTPPFGEKVELVFSSAIDDIRAAGRCLALGCGTATVFHLMRATEDGFRSVAKELGVDYAPSWESYERKLKSLLDSANYHNLTEVQKAKRPFYDQILSDISTIKMVWRNPTMHIVKSYDVEQARTIYAATERFMRHLAENLEPIEAHVISTGQSV